MIASLNKSVKSIDMATSMNIILGAVKITARYGHMKSLVIERKLYVRKEVG